MSMKLKEFAFQQKDPEILEQGNKLAIAVAEALPKTEDGTNDFEAIGKMFADACFGAVGVEATEEARSGFMALLLQTGYGVAQKKAESTPLSGIVKGIINSQTVSDSVAKFFAGMSK